MNEIIVLIIIVCLVVTALVSYYAGYKKGKEKHESAVGVYRFDEWDGDQTVVLVLNEDGTCTLPTGETGVWFQSKDTIKIISDNENNTVNMVGDAEGIVYNGFFFEKVH